LPRRVFPVVVTLLLVIGGALLIPGSPVSLPVLLAPGEDFYNGHGTRYWLNALGSPDAEARHQAIFALGAIGPKRPEVVPALARILTTDPDAEARQQAALALRKMRATTRAAVPELTQALEDQEPAVRMNAALTLAGLGPEARAAVPALIQAVEREGNRMHVGGFYVTIQEEAALALGRATAGSAEGVPALTGALQAARSAEGRAGLARALGEVGAAARPAVPQLRALLQDDSLDVREAAEKALKKIESEGPQE
jgi:HEAT repeat protein